MCLCEGAIAASWENDLAPTTGNQGSAASSEVGSILLFKIGTLARKMSFLSF